MKFAQLLSDVSACKLCEPYLPLGCRPVFQLHPQARILVVGQAPGRRVHETGIPFNDPSGDRLRQWMGVDRATFYDPHKIALLPMGFCYPGTGKSGDLPPRPECAATWRSQLLAHLENVELTLLLGQYARDWHLPGERKQPLAHTARNWQARWPELVVLPHPSPRNQRWFRNNPWLEAELIPAIQARVALLGG